MALFLYVFLSFFLFAAIRTIRSRLACAMKARGDKRWVEALDTFIAHYNAQPLKDTGLARRDVTKESYVEAVKKLWKAADETAVISTRVWRNIPDEIGDCIFRFKVGQRVYLSQSAIPSGVAEDKDPNKRKGAASIFFKKTEHGNYWCNRIFVIFSRYLQTCSNFHFAPVYTVNSTRISMVYQSEIIECEEAVEEEEEEEEPAAAPPTDAATESGRTTRKKVPKPPATLTLAATRERRTGFKPQRVSERKK